ncbi:hypothetical protein AAG906_011248 [Vitis piasezkii]
MPSKLPKKLPPRKPTDHHIKLVSGVKLPAEVPYRMTPLELVELRKQLTELLDIHIAKGDESKTTYMTRYGSYEFLVMPFGLTNASVMFCNLMNDVLFDFLNSFVVITSELVLRLPNLELPFEVWIDASYKALGDFDFVWVHRAGRHNQVVDALSCKEVTKFLGFLSRVVVDFNAKCSFAPHECPIKEFARLFFSNVVELFKMMGIECKFSTTNHPRWMGKPRDSTIGKSPFEVAIGFQPCMLMDVLATSQLREGLESSCGATHGHNDIGVVGTWMGCLRLKSHVVIGKSTISTIRTLMCEHIMHKCNNMSHVQVDLSRHILASGRLKQGVASCRRKHGELMHHMNKTLIAWDF